MNERNKLNARIYLNMSVHVAHESRVCGDKRLVPNKEAFAYIVLVINLT